MTRFIWILIKLNFLEHILMKVLFSYVVIIFAKDQKVLKQSFDWWLVNLNGCHGTLRVSIFLVTLFHTFYFRLLKQRKPFCLKIGPNEGCFFSHISRETFKLKTEWRNKWQFRTRTGAEKSEKIEKSMELKNQKLKKLLIFILIIGISNLV